MTLQFMGHFSIPNIKLPGLADTVHGKIREIHS